MSSSEPFVVSEYARVLGGVLRVGRKRRGWTRKELCAHLSHDISIQTLATYELGTRHVNVDRLDQLARVLGTRAHALLVEVDQILYGPSDRRYQFTVNLDTLAATRHGDLAPAAKWAAVQARVLANGATSSVDLTSESIGLLATLCRMSYEDMCDALDAHRVTGRTRT